MKKKTFIVVSIIATVLVGVGITSYALLQDNFSFSNLTVDISQTNALGFGLINPAAPLNNRRNQAASSEDDKFNKLLKVNEDGDVEIIRFYNEGENEVQIPFHPILIENYGDFTYVVYADWPAEYHGQPSNFRLNKFFWSSYGQESWNREKLFNYEFVAIHKTSGKVFDLKESIINQHTQSKTLSSTLVYLPDGFAYTTDPSERDNQVCINRGEFNMSTEVIDMTVVCTDLIAGFEDFDTTPTALPNGDIKLRQLNGNVNQAINLYTLELFNTNELLEDDPRKSFFSLASLYGYVAQAFISSERISWSPGGTIYTLNYIDNQFTLDIVESTLNQRSFVYVPRNPYSSANFISTIINSSVDSIQVDLYDVNPKTLEAESILSFDLLDYEPELMSVSLDNYFFNDMVYLVNSGSKPFIYEVDLETEVFTKIFSSIGNGYYFQEKTRNPNFFLFGEEFYFSQDVRAYFKRTGNFYFSEVSGLVETRYKFNIYDKQTYTEAQSTPTFSYFEIVPIN
jgi:hypothetical protein